MAATNLRHIGRPITAAEQAAPGKKDSLLRSPTNGLRCVPALSLPLGASGDSGQDVVFSRQIFVQVHRVRRPGLDAVVACIQAFVNASPRALRARTPISIIHVDTKAIVS